MSYKFSSPIKLRGRLGFQRTITDVWQATEFLLDWTSHLQGLHYYTALDACSAALKDRGGVEAAQDAFWHFAEHVGILAYDVDVAAADRLAAADLVSAR